MMISELSPDCVNSESHPPPKIDFFEVVNGKNQDIQHSQKERSSKMTKVQSNKIINSLQSQQQQQSQSSPVVILPQPNQRRRRRAREVLTGLSSTSHTPPPSTTIIRGVILLQARIRGFLTRLYNHDVDTLLVDLKEEEYISQIEWERLESMASERKDTLVELDATFLLLSEDVDTRLSCLEKECRRKADKKDKSSSSAYSTYPDTFSSPTSSTTSSDAIDAIVAPNASFRIRAPDTLPFSSKGNSSPSTVSTASNTTTSTTTSISKSRYAQSKKSLANFLEKNNQKSPMSPTRDKNHRLMKSSRWHHGGSSRSLLHSSNRSLGRWGNGSNHDNDASDYNTNKAIIEKYLRGRQQQRNACSNNDDTFSQLSASSRSLNYSSDLDDVSHCTESSASTGIFSVGSTQSFAYLQQQKEYLLSLQEQAIEIDRERRAELEEIRVHTENTLNKLSKEYEKEREEFAFWVDNPMKLQHAIEMSEDLKVRLSRENEELQQEMEDMKQKIENEKKTMKLAMKTAHWALIVSEFYSPNKDKNVSVINRRGSIGSCSSRKSTKSNKSNKSTKSNKSQKKTSSRKLSKTSKEVHVAGNIDPDNSRTGAETRTSIQNRTTDDNMDVHAGNSSKSTDDYNINNTMNNTNKDDNNGNRGRSRAAENGSTRKVTARRRSRSLGCNNHNRRRVTEDSTTRRGPRRSSNRRQALARNRSQSLTSMQAGTAADASSSASAAVNDNNSSNNDTKSSSRSPKKSTKKSIAGEKSPTSLSRQRSSRLLRQRSARLGLRF